MKSVSLLAAAACVAACNGNEIAPLTASNVTISAPLPGTSMSVGYLTLTNNSEATITVTAVTSPQFGRIEMHESIVENDISRMRQLDAIRVEPDTSVSLEPGSKHLMLTQPGEPLHAVTLQFYDDHSLLLSITTEVSRR